MRSTAAKAPAQLLKYSRVRARHFDAKIMRVYLETESNRVADLGLFLDPMLGMSVES